MATQVISLPQIPQGWYMSWFMATQASFNICVTLNDSAKTYVNNQCRASQSFGTLAQGYDQVDGSDMTLTVDIASSDEILVVNQPVSVPNVKGIIIAQGAVLCFEDASDQDFNDLYVSIMAWQKSG